MVYSNSLLYSIFRVENINPLIYIIIKTLYVQFVILPGNNPRILFSCLAYK